MAKLNAYYGLCPLIDHKNFLGISKAAEHGHIIVTQSKNIALKYRLADQKQIQSWRTKDKFTSCIVFDKAEDKLVAVFNHVNLRLWGHDDIEHLDKIKKYKFSKPIYTVLSCNDTTFLIFKNGSILTLKNALEQRKELEIKNMIDVNNDEITDVVHICFNNIVYICLIVRTKSALNCLWTSFSGGCPDSSYQKIKLGRCNLNLSSYTFCEMYNKYLHLLTLWSDGQLYSYLIAGPNSQEFKATYTEEFGSLHGTIESISCKQNVAMVALTSDHIAIYGADCNQEGASVIIYNTQFKVSQSRQRFKLFSNTNRIWCLNNMLLLCSGQNLAVVPFHINTEQLSQLVGSHKIDVCDTDLQQTYTFEKWNIEEENDFSKAIPAKIKTNVMNCLSQGVSEVAVCDLLIPSYIENSDIKAIENCLDYFKDISEGCLIKILAYLIENQLLYDKNTHDPNRNELVEKILSFPHTTMLLLPHIKINLNINSTLHLLRYISYMLTSESCLPGLDCVQTEGKLLEWGCVLIDGNYQQFLLTRDVVVHEVLNNFNAIVQEHLVGLNDLKSAEPVINEFVKRKSSNRQNSNAVYSVEEVKLY